MSDIPVALVRQVVERAARRCEYCGLSQLGQEATFRVAHIVPRSEDGPTVLDNLALAGVSCSLRKRSPVHGYRLDTRTDTPTLNPGSQR